MIWNMRQISGTTQWTSQMGTLGFLIQKDRDGHSLKVRYSGDDRYTHVGTYSTLEAAQGAVGT